LDAFSKENEDTPQAIDYLNEFNISPDYEELSEFSTEFLIEFTKNRFLNPVVHKEPMQTPPPDDNELEVPPQAKGWIEKMASKFGFDNLGFKDLVYLYILNRFNQEKEDGAPRMRFSESAQLILNEKAPPGMEGWIKSAKASFQEQYGEDWEEVLYATAWDRYKKGGKKKVKESYDYNEISYKEMQSVLENAGWNENGSIALWSHPDHPNFWVDGNTGNLWVFPTTTVDGPFTDASNETVLEIFDNMDNFVEWVNSGKGDARAKEYVDMATEAGWKGFVKEDVGDIYGGATKQDHFPRPEDRKAPKVTTKVKNDVAKRIKELDGLISDYEEKKHFYGEVKPAIFNAKEALVFIMDKLNSGSYDDYRKAQMHLQKVHSSIADLFPPTLIKFLAYGNDGEDSKLKSVGD
jgi:hypothetical protein